MSRLCRVMKNSRSEGFTTTWPVSWRSRNSFRLRIKISYGVSGIVPRSRSRVRSISAMGRSLNEFNVLRIWCALLLSAGCFGGFVVRRLFQLMETRAAIDAGRGEQIWFDRQKGGGRGFIAVEVLDHDAVALGRQVENVAGFPFVLDAVEQRVTTTLDDEHDLSALELEPAGAAAGRDFLAVDRKRRQDGVGDRRVQIPAHQAVLVVFQRQLRKPDHLDGGLARFPLPVAQGQQFIPAIEGGKFGGSFACHESPPEI